MSLFLPDMLPPGIHGQGNKPFQSRTSEVRSNSFALELLPVGHPNAVLYKLPHLQSNNFVFCGCYNKEKKSYNLSCVSVRFGGQYNVIANVDTHTRNRVILLRIK
jgi:hypothetical protein